MSNWRELYPRQVTGPDDAAAFVAAVGFCTWLPVPGLDFPNLGEKLVGLSAVLGEARESQPTPLGPVVDSHAVLNQTWFWKDDLHLERRVYYAKVIRAQPSFIAPDFLPDFIAALPADERAPQRLYLDGRLGREAALIYDYLRDYPARPTRDLRRGARLGTSNLAATVERALLDLQRRFVICKVDITGRTRGTYAYVWDLAERFWPDAFARAQSIPTEAARDRIRDRLAEVGIELTPVLENRLFLWGDRT